MRVAGRPVSYIVEEHSDPDRIDHVWIDVDTGEHGLVRIALNTWSRISRRSGFEDRMFLRVVPGKWEDLPAPGIELSGDRTYEEGKFKPMAPRSLEQLFIDRAGKSLLVEAWGELYLTPAPGIHQVHSRRSSCAVETSVKGRDGAVRFYFKEGNRSETFLLKFCGQ